jgi:enhancer of polycomb-like protein
LQTILKDAGTSNDQEIPVPPPEESAIDYDALYPSQFHQPSSYIRFSQTVEECISCQYDMTVEDDTFLKEYNSKRPATGSLSEDDFEYIMEVFEDTAAEQTPFASVDNTVVAYEMMVPGLNHLDSQHILQHAKAIYEYWKTRRQEMGNKPIHPTLKFETHQESDDTDPYVCFRRREARQTRKTRARDNKIADTLKRLRRELEDGRQLVILSAEREVMKLELLHADRAVFEERARLKQMKIKLGIKEGDEDLVNQKPQKRKAPEAPVMQRPSAAMRVPVRPDGRTVDSDLTLLSDKLAEKENEFRADIELKVQNHRKWNSNHIDLTRDPLSPVREQGMEQKFRPAKTQYLMTPPASISSEEMDVDQEDSHESEAMQLDKPDPPILHFKAGGFGDSPESKHPAFRRRIGRLNRLWIDRRGVSTRREESNEYCDRWKYDSDSEDDEPNVYEVDAFDTRALKFRATIPLSQFMFSRRPELGPGPTGSASHGQRALPPSQAAAQVAQAVQVQATQAAQMAQAQAAQAAHIAQATPTA